MQIFRFPNAGPKNIVVCAAGILVWVLLVFPQIPIQFRYLAVLLAGMCLFHPSIHAAPGMRLIAGFTIYVCLVGACVVLFANDGSLGEAMYFIRTMSVAGFIMLFCMNVTLNGFAVMSSAVLVGAFVGVVLDTYRGPAWQLVPFPIFSETQLMMMGERYMLSERVGGFTFEAGVVGGMTALFMLINVSVLIIDLCNPRIRLSKLSQLLLVATLGLGLLTSYLCKTKSGIAVLGLGLLFFCVFLIIGRRVGPIWLRPVAGAFLAILLFGAPVGYRAISNTSMGQYLQVEMDNIYRLVTRGFDRTEGFGLKTRIESMKLSLYSLPTRPWGGGITTGRYYTEHGLKAIEPTDEMEWFHNMGRFNGYKGAIWNVIGMAGLVGVYFLIVLYYKIWKGITRGGVLAGAPVAIMLLVALAALGVSAEMLPYVEIVMFVLGLATAVQNSLFTPMEEGRVGRHGMLRRLMLKARSHAFVK